ncbi:MAG: restriction endonuclease subunit S [Lawsonibacter sp.]|nr:restriction endonuclease subunit S [Lawsonibacter sp.]
MRFLDLIRLNPSIPLKKGEEYPFIEMASVGTDSREPLRIARKAFVSGVRFEDGDSVIARIEPCLQNGKKFFCHGIGAGFGSTEFLVFRPRDERMDPKYLYYLLQTNSLRETMIRSMTGASGRQRINTGVFRSIELQPPELGAQKRVGEILSAYDDLIENNRKQIALLEEAALRLYREWFTSLRFPGHEAVPPAGGLPEGWRRSRADSFFEITIGKTPPRAGSQWFSDMYGGVPWVSIADMGNTDTFIFETSEGLTEEAVERFHVKVVPADTVILSFKLTMGQVSITTADMCTNEAIAHFRTELACLREYTYCYLREFPYDTLGSTSGISRAVNSKVIQAMPFILPPLPLLEAFSDRARPIFDSVRARQGLSARLREARDRLLPKLMSGEIEV